METKNKKPQVEFENFNQTREHDNADSDAAYFPSQAAVNAATRLIDKIKSDAAAPPTPAPVPVQSQLQPCPPAKPPLQFGSNSAPNMPGTPNMPGVSNMQAAPFVPGTAPQFNPNPAFNPTNPGNSGNPARPPKRRAKPAKPPKTPEAIKEEARQKKRALKKKMKRREEHIRTFSHIFISVLLIVFVVAVSAFLSQYLVRAFLDFTGITATEYQVTVDVPPEATADEIAQLLKRYDIIAMPGLFKFYTRVSGKDGDFLSGSLNFTSTMSYSQIIYTLKNPVRSTETVTVKITEGMTAREIAELLEKNQVCRAEDFMAFFQDKIDFKYRFERRVLDNPLKFMQMEGYLFPDTHEFYVITGLADNPDIDTSRDAEVAARTIYSHFNNQITDEMYKRMGDMGFTLDELMTIASLVQWEAAHAEDMRNVASVFLNRLKTPSTFPRMQSDVTNKYIRENIAPYRNDSNAATLDAIILAYDTYESAGLPPGPVCNPGMAAIAAVLGAPQTDFYYFCADVNTGEMYFAKNLREHEANLVKANIDINNVRR